uniref:Arginine kinase n=1 Tax=Strombidinopsis acuminata TaxID=141414 RepID=A0A7S3T0B8_9SPIT|mmetsp:Transcript_48843/g.66505  ORF Transcript_48843/g.66505 Transcript_48843/m.66505 type:complete len:368 (+) Transcript_48843:54-1157(+)
MGCSGSKDGQDPKPTTSKSGADSITEFPTFPADCKSQLCKCLSKDIWEEYKDQKDKYGVTFKTCIFSGVKNLDSGIGVYAGSHEAYSQFNKLFDQVIQNYHGHAPTAKHVSNMNSADLVAPPFGEEDAKMIKSTRIRVGRNLAGFPLGPGVTKEQRLEIMNAVVEACKNFEGDLKGTFYPLEGMDETTQKQLIDDHFLFKEGDRFLEACNLNRDWPSGRGIFHNDDKTFLVWVNEEDQLRIISMQNGADIGAVFDRLSRAAKTIEQVAKFSHDEHLGYITSCPTNLGTALRASVHIRLPKLSQDMTKFQGIADKYNVQIRGIHGEHSETVDSTYDISNKRRLGMSEVALVQDMYEGVKAMIAAEKEM